MGVINHNAVIATAQCGDNQVRKVLEWVDSLPEDLKGLFIVNRNVLANSATTIVLTPDGSKEGWDASARGDSLRDQFIKLLRSFNYEDESNPFDWVEVSYGEYGTSIVDEVKS